MIPNPYFQRLCGSKGSCFPEATCERAVDADSDFIICCLKNVLTETSMTNGPQGSVFLLICFLFNNLFVPYGMHTHVYVLYV